ncbi:hypothetical protein [Bradyrhizobium canariense]|uniref:Uncharacterized protein n=1 Tax=Bradyrhizobium canariense TaxID=255045 RepID=A0A1X3GCL3_9BRAD|nr:hypothetical protein [Bradyrhizobium canariense]OSI60277.1 hypothetical protein BSZ21_38575 [Bradyrhizobium canariense]OSI65388.1 hypothetical protein BSZ22_31285 [Bradyrhizobium canariense]OSI75830.1 hypothetical protein BSZ23_27355 [Bradyrhizobium canariense]OSI85587.1 hypothetical protein BSZ24_31485 [Bradyrhizobium canariense]OSI87046.1 hypothetical protein BSZ25_28215 [Bradyrhizobium canariense]
MTDNTNALAPNARHEDDRRVDGAGSGVAIDRRSTPDACGHRPVWPVKEQPDRRWPFKAADVVPLQWWRTLPSDALRDAEQSLMLTTLDRIGVLHPVDDLKAALAGDAAAAISIAFSMMPIEKTTLAIDIGMTALCRCALARNAASALVMAQVIGLTNFDHGLSIELAMSWYRHGLRHASDPRKFREAETVLLKAFHELDRSGSR